MWELKTSEVQCSLFCRYPLLFCHGPLAHLWSGKVPLIIADIKRVNFPNSPPPTAQAPQILLTPSSNACVLLRLLLWSIRWRGQETRAALAEHRASGLLNCAATSLLFICPGESCSLYCTVSPLPGKQGKLPNRFLVREFSWELKILILIYLYMLFGLVT